MHSGQGHDRSDHSQTREQQSGWGTRQSRQRIDGDNAQISSREWANRTTLGNKNKRAQVQEGESNKQSSGMSITKRFGMSRTNPSGNRSQGSSFLVFAFQVESFRLVSSLNRQYSLTYAILYLSLARDGNVLSADLLSGFQRLRRASSHSISALR